MPLLGQKQGANVWTPGIEPMLGVRDRLKVVPSGRAVEMPGVEMPGHLRIFLTATEAMIERALPVFNRRHNPGRTQPAARSLDVR